MDFTATRAGPIGTFLRYARRQILTGLADTKNWPYGNGYLATSAICFGLCALWLFLISRAGLPDLDNQVAATLIVIVLSVATGWHTLELENSRVVLQFGFVASFIGMFFVTPTNLILACIVGRLLTNLLDTFAHQAILANIMNELHYVALMAIVFCFVDDDPYALTLSNVMIASVWALFVTTLEPFWSTFAFHYIETAKKDRTTPIGEELRGTLKWGSVSACASAILLSVSAACLLMYAISAWSLLLSLPIGILVLTGLNKYSRPRRDAEILKMLFKITERIQTSNRSSDPIDLLARTLIEERGGTYAEVLITGGNVVRSTRFCRYDIEPTNTIVNDPTLLPRLISALDSQTSFRQSDNIDVLEDRFNELHLKVILGAQLRSRNGVVGVLLLGSRHMSYGVFMKSKPEALGTFANAAVTALQIDQLSSSVDQLDAAQEHLWHQATHDALTGLANRRLFAERAQHALNSRDPRVAIICIDLDRLKVVNDQLGHAVGDQLIKTAAAFFESICDPADTVARLGGDEFAILVENTTPDEAAELTQSIMDDFRVDHLAGDQPISAGASAGYAYAQPKVSFQDLLQLADAALYESKKLRQLRDSTQTGMDKP
jgi:diguanylate cyclase (GGDEF)-like protein